MPIALTILAASDAGTSSVIDQIGAPPVTPDAAPAPTGTDLLPPAPADAPLGDVLVVGDLMVDVVAALASVGSDVLDPYMTLPGATRVPSDDAWRQPDPPSTSAHASPIQRSAR